MSNKKHERESMFCSSMENWERGELADIVTVLPSSDSWQFSTAEDTTYLFKDPIFNTPAAVTAGGSVLRLDAGGNDDSEEEIMMMMIKNSSTQQQAAANNDIFSRLLQISPNHVSPAPAGSSPDQEKAVPEKRVQISSPPPGNTVIKSLRKSPAKTVVCIPAPTPANSGTRSSGEVVPSDLWAWRKYGQKPIKGSPFPRGYYRCSSSKGCSARKQVERSRNDPNMLVITYTSEHNHPWPTQKNALAGSTRSQPNKVSINSKSKSIFTRNSQPHKLVTKITCAKDEEINNMVENNSVKGGEQMDHTLMSSYKPIFSDYNLGHCDDDLFADLGEIDEDPFGLLFGQEKGGNLFDNWNMDIINVKDKEGLL